MTLDVTCSHHLEKNGKKTTLTIPLRVRDVQGLSGFALAKADPFKKRKQMSIYLIVMANNNFSCSIVE